MLLVRGVVGVCYPKGVGVCCSYHQCWRYNGVFGRKKNEYLRNIFFIFFIRSQIN